MTRGVVKGKELYRDTLERFRQIADDKCPGKLLFTQKEAAEILGVTDRTLRNKGIEGSMVTIEQLAWVFC